MKEGIDIIIVNYYSLNKLKPLLKSIEASDFGGIEVSIIIASNSNERELKDLQGHENLQLIINDCNKGFGYACNQALTSCTHSYVLLLNPDTVLKKNTLYDSFHFMEKNKEVTVLGVQHLNTQNEIAASCSRFPQVHNFLNEIFGLNKIFKRSKGASLMIEWDHSHSVLVDQVMGAFMFIRKEFIDKFGLMDDRFFMFYEDMDFCKKVWSNGGKVYYNSTIQVEHEGMSSTENSVSAKLYYIIQSRLKYARKHFNSLSYITLFIATVFVEPFSRMVFQILKGSKKGIKETFKAYLLFFKKQSNYSSKDTGKKILYFTKYTEAGSASRYRSYQYFPYFKKEGYTIECKPLFPSKYIQILYEENRKSILTILFHYCKRFFQILFLKKYDIIFIERELFPFVPYFIEKWLLRNKKNIILDFDDAIFHIYDQTKNPVIQKLLGSKINRLVKLADVVITGSPYLTNTLRKYNPNTIEIPTSIVFENYNKPIIATSRKTFRIGWIGSGTTSCYLSIVTEAIRRIQTKYDIELFLIGFNKKDLHLLDGINYKLENWNSETEVPLLHSFDIGIMPLADEPFEKGKCGFKLVQYMACGVPTISTPLEANVKINRNSKNLHANSTTEWEACFEKVINEKIYFKQIVGEENIRIVEHYYSVEANYKYYLDIFDLVLASEPTKIKEKEKLHFEICNVAEV